MERLTGPSVVPQLHTDGCGQKSRPLPLVLSGRLERKHHRALGQSPKSPCAASSGDRGRGTLRDRTARKTRPCAGPAFPRLVWVRALGLGWCRTALVTFLILLSEVLAPDKYIKSVLFLEELGEEIIFSRSGMCLLD